MPANLPLPANLPHHFIDWLDEELSLRGWSDNELARRAGISHSVISKARAGTPPRWRACDAIAVALQLPAELVFRKAGLLLPAPEDGREMEEWSYVLARLSAANRYELLRIARLKLELQAPGGEAPEGSAPEQPEEEDHSE